MSVFLSSVCACMCMYMCMCVRMCVSVGLTVCLSFGLVSLFSVRISIYRRAKKTYHYVSIIGCYVLVKKLHQAAGKPFAGEANGGWLCKHSAGCACLREKPIILLAKHHINLN